MFCALGACSGNGTAEPSTPASPATTGANVEVHVETVSECHELEFPHHGPLGADAVQVDVRGSDVIFEIWNAAAACPDAPSFTASYEAGRLVVDRENHAPPGDRHREITLRISGVPSGAVDVEWSVPLEGATAATSSYSVTIP